jgi:hypothetical protein
MQGRGGSPIRDGQGGEFRDRGPDELADRRGPQAAAFRDRSHGRAIGRSERYGRLLLAEFRTHDDGTTPRNGAGATQAIDRTPNRDVTKGGA